MTNETYQGKKRKLGRLKKKRDLKINTYLGMMIGGYSFALFGKPFIGMLTSDERWISLGIVGGLGTSLVGMLLATGEGFERDKQRNIRDRYGPRE